MASIDKYVELIKMLEKLFGKGAVSRTIGTRTNVVKFPRGQIVDDLDTTKSEYNIEKVAEKKSMAYQVVKKDIEDRIGDITKMNDSELLNYTANVRRMMNVEFPPPLPEADVVKFGSGEEIKGKGLETLIEKEGTRFSPTTDIGRLEATGKKLEKLSEDFTREFDPANIAKQEAERQAMIARQYEGKGFAGGVFGPSGMYRAVARSFLLDQHAKGKIKLDPTTIKNLEDRNYLSGGQPLMYADPIRVMRYHYGDDVFEKIPLDKIPTGARSEIIDVMSKVEAPPIRTEPPKTPGGYLTPGEYRANIEEMQKIEDSIKRRESRFADMTEEEIQNELAQYGGKRSSFEMGLEQDYPEEFAKYKKPKDIDEPEGKAYGGRIGYSGGSKLEGILDVVKKDYDKSITKKIIDKGDEINETVADALRRQVESRLTDEQRKKMNRFLGIRDATLQDIIKDSSKENISAPLKKRKEEADDGRKEEADGGRIGFSRGKKVMSEIDKLIEKLNKKTKGKKSMESVDPKTGEVTTPKKPIRRAEEPTGMTTMDPEPEIVDEKSVSKVQQKTTTPTEKQYYMYDAFDEMDKLTIKHKKAAEAHDQLDLIDVYDKIASNQLAEVMAEMDGKNLDNLTNAQSMEYYKKAQAYLDDFIKIKRTKIAVDRSNEGLDLTATDRLYLKFAEPETKAVTVPEQSTIKVEPEKPIPGAFSFNDPEIKAGMEKAMAEAKKRGDEMRAMGLDPASGRDYDKYIEIKTKSGDKDFNKYFDDLEIETKFKGVISDDLLNKILTDDDPQRKAEVIATIEQGLKMQEKGMDPEEIVNILKNAPRTKQAEGGIAGLL